MRRALLCLSVLVLLAAPRAVRAGIGTTWAFNGGSAASYGGPWTDLGYTFPFHSLPSLDLKLKEMDLQFHVLEFIGGIANDTILLGANAHFQGLWRPAPGGFGGVLEPGVSLDIVADTDFDPFHLGLMGLARLGIEAEKTYGCGVYVVPALGVGLISEDFELLVGGSLQFSAWLP
ncbi:MAG: hypothetical protein JXB39_13705 [Deltaproteobacteria bacterium]|nr:hypothetical protein [Deltaproteobacteria bacterium]